MTRNTTQCLIIKQAVLSSKNHPTADEVYALVHVDHPSISRATVYRDLTKLASLGQIRHIAVPGGADRFDYRLDDHCHVQCQRCGQLIDIEMKDVPDLKQYVIDPHGYEISGYDIVLMGICPQCQSC